MAECHPPCGGCGLKSSDTADVRFRRKSPSVWRVWIEIGIVEINIAGITSPSVWRVWIEIFLSRSFRTDLSSPSVWRV